MLGDSVKRRQPRAGAKATKSAPRRRKGGGVGRRLLVALPLALVLPFAIGYLIAVFVLFPAPEVSGAGIPVPDLTGVSSAEAQRAVTGAGLGPIEVSELPHPSVSAGRVIAQDPLPGQQLRAGAGVRVALSAGRPRGAVPDVAGYSSARAQSILQRAGFTISEVTQESAVPSGRVVRTQPAAGEQVTLPSQVTVIVSTGLAQPPVDSMAAPSDVPPGGVPAGPPSGAPAGTPIPPHAPGRYPL